jgi:hypothetical protein
MKFEHLLILVLALAVGWMARDYVKRDPSPVISVAPTQAVQVVAPVGTPYAVQTMYAPVQAQPVQVQPVYVAPTPLPTMTAVSWQDAITPEVGANPTQQNQWILNVTAESGTNPEQAPGLCVECITPGAGTIPGVGTVP